MFSFGMLSQKDYCGFERVPGQPGLQTDPVSKNQTNQKQTKKSYNLLSR